MINHELTELVDDGDGIQITFALRASPRKEAMPTENDSVAARVRLNRVP